MDNPENQKDQIDKNAGQEANGQGKNNLASFPSDEKLETKQDKPNKINKYLVIVAILIIILLIIAYILYHFNILGVRALVRNTLGLNHNTAITTTPPNSSSLNSTVNPALLSTVKSYFPSLNLLNSSKTAINANNLNNSYILHYSVFGEGNITNAFQKGISPQNYSGILMLFLILKNNQTLGYYYKDYKEAENSNTKIYNTSFNGTPAFVRIFNITPPSNKSISSFRGALNLSSYHCNSSGLNLTFKNNMNETIGIKNITVFNQSNSYGNNSIFSTSGAAMPGNSLTAEFPKMICNPSSYQLIISGYTNYSISNLSRFITFISFSKKLSKSTQQEIITALGVSNSKLYEVNVLAGGNNYIAQVNTSLNHLLQNLEIKYFN